MNSTKLFAARKALAIAARRSVSDIRINPKRVVVNGKTYTRMVYPYTYSAKFAKFPWALDWKEVWMTRYFVIACIVSYPLWVFVNNLVNSPEAKAAWAEKKHQEHVKAHKQPWEV